MTESASLQIRPTWSRVSSRLPLLSITCVASSRFSSIGIWEAIIARALFLAEAAAFDQPLHLQRLGHVDQHGGRVEPLEPVLKQKRNVLYDDLRATFDRLGCAGRHPLPDKGMHDRVQAAAGGAVVEHELTQPGAVDAAIAHVLRPELASHGLESRAAGFVRGVSGFVRIDDGRAELFQHRGHSRLS